MIPLHKPVRRRTRLAYAVLYTRVPRPIVVSLEPGDMIAFREAGGRLTWPLPVERAFRVAVRDAAEWRRLERRRRTRKS